MKYTLFWTLFILECLLCGYLRIFVDMGGYQMFLILIMLLLMTIELLIALFLESRKNNKEYKRIDEKINEKI